MKINFDNHKWLQSQKPQTKFGYNFFGRPIFKNKTELNFHDIEGIWIAIKKENFFIEIISDVCGSHRVYYETINNVFIESQLSQLSIDVKSLISSMLISKLLESTFSIIFFIF